jgi:hypothetical protein
VIGVESVIRIVPPFVRVGGAADLWVLVELEEIGVFQDGQVGLVDGVQLWAVWKLSYDEL